MNGRYDLTLASKPMRIRAMRFQRGFKERGRPEPERNRRPARQSGGLPVGWQISRKLAAA